MGLYPQNITKWANWSWPIPVSQGRRIDSCDLKMNSGYWYLHIISSQESKCLEVHRHSGRCILKKMCSNHILIPPLSSLSFWNSKSQNFLYRSIIKSRPTEDLIGWMEEKSFCHTPCRKQFNKAPLCIFLQSPIIGELWAGIFFSLTSSSRKPMAFHLPALSPLLGRIFFICTKPRAQQEPCFYPTLQAYQSIYSKANLFLLQRNSHTSWQEDSVFSICYISFVIWKAILHLLNLSI